MNKPTSQPTNRLYDPAQEKTITDSARGEYLIGKHHHVEKLSVFLYMILSITAFDGKFELDSAGGRNLIGKHHTV
jgi:hypothetical protein